MMKTVELIPMAAAVMVALAVSSCTEKDDFSEASLDSKYVYLVVNSENSSETKASGTVQESSSMKITGDGESLFITATKSINADNPFAEEPQTKGSEKTADDISEGFEMHMVSDADSSLYYRGIVEKSGVQAQIPYWSFYSNKSQKINWPEDAENGARYSFVSCINSDNTSVSNFNYKARTIDYTGMVHSSGAVNDAEKIEDMLVAYTSGVQHDHGSQNLVNLHFYHPLAAVRIFVTDKVKKITLSSIRKDGTLKYYSVNPDDADDFKKAFSWSVSQSDQNLTDYVQKVNAADIDATTGYAEYEFFVLPHDFAKENVKLTFDVEGTDGDIHQISTLANNLGVESWDAGYRYSYYVDEVSVRKIGLSVSESFVNYVKSNVGVQNTKRSTAYVRAAVVANWETESGNIISSFNGTINYNVGSSSDWVLGDDGFYYYKKPLVGFSVTEPLVDSFEDNATSAQLNFQLSKYRLVWQILVQGVEYDSDKQYVSEAWADVTAGGSSLVNMLETE